MSTNTRLCEGREPLCEAHCEGQNPRRYWLVKGVKGKTTRVRAGTRRTSRHQTTRNAITAHVYTRALRALHTLHKSIVVRVSDVKGNFKRASRLSHIPGMTKKPLREKMPTVAGWIDDLRAAFGEAEINDAIRAGINGRPTFHARENGHEIGTAAVDVPEKTISMADTLVGPLNPPKTKG